MSPVTRAIAAAAAAAFMRPLWAEASIVEVTRSSPASTAVAEESIITTSCPEVARLTAMPLPMVPAPITATDCTTAEFFRVALAAGRSAKNRCRKARDSSDTRHSSNRRRESASAASKGW